MVGAGDVGSLDFPTLIIYNAHVTSLASTLETDHPNCSLNHGYAHLLVHAYVFYQYKSS